MGKPHFYDWGGSQIKRPDASPLTQQSGVSRHQRQFITYTNFKEEVN